MAAARGSVVVTGIREIDRKLRRLEPAVQKKVVRQAMRAGLKVLQAAVKALAPVDRGILKRNVVVRAARRRKRGTIELEVRVDANDQTKKTSRGADEAVFYPAVVEYGNRDTPPNPFMRRAFEAAGEIARQVTLRALLRGIERVAASIGGKASGAPGGNASGGAPATLSGVPKPKATPGRDAKGRFISVKG